MSDPDNLAAFITWTVQRYPAQHYLLMLADHGYGWKGLLTDESSFGNHMTMSGLKQAIDKSGAHIDLLAMNACLMQMIEVAYELHDSAVDIMVGSEMPGMKWLSPPPRHNPAKSKEVQNPLEIAGFFLLFVQRCVIRFIKFLQFWGLIDSKKPPKKRNCTCLKGSRHYLK
jgi:hypothetical protein